MQLLQILSVLGMSAYMCTALDFDDVSKDIKDEMRIYGGDDADASKVPYIASVRKSADGETYCGGALIAPQYVLTAAHCVKNTTMYVSLGSRYRTGAKEGQRIEIKESYVHPQYEASKHLNDVGILKLAKPTTIKPVSLCNADGSESKENTIAVVRGWGVTENGKPPDELKELNVRIQSNAQCNKLFNNRIADSMLCAGEGGGKDTCQGDSGGPLVNKNVLIGVVSWGGTCGEKAGVYTRVTSVLDFINETINGKTPKAPTVAPAPAPTTPKAPTVAPAPAPTPPTAAPTPYAPSTQPPTPKPETPAPTTQAPAPTAETAAPTTQAPEPTTATPTTTPSTPSTPSPAEQVEPAPVPAPEPSPVPAPIPAPEPAPGPAPGPAPAPPAVTPRGNCGVKE